MTITKWTERLLSQQNGVEQTYSVLAFISFAIFGAVHVLGSGQRVVGYLEFVCSAVMGLNILLSRYGHAIATVRATFLLTVLGFLMAMLVSGGIHDTGILWFFAFPMSAFFLDGKQRGIGWVLALFASVLFLWIASEYHKVVLAYDGETIRQLLASMVVMSLGIYAYQVSRERLAMQAKRTRHSLHSERARADEIVEHIDEGIVTTDAEGRMTYMNHIAEKLLGWREKELHGKHFVEAVPMFDAHGKAVGADARPLNRSLKESGSVNIEATYCRKDGSMLPVSVTGTSLVVGGEIVGAVGTFRDISEERSLMKAKSEFVTLASHQLRTPISAISWVSELLLSGDAGKLTPEQREHIEDIYRSNRRMATLVSEMLIDSSLELDALAVAPESVNVVEVTKTVVKEQVAAHADRHPTIVQNYVDGLEPLMCDPSILQLLLRNLISNAIKYSPIGKPITVNIDTDTKQLVSEGSRGSVVITVEDQGYGIPEASASKIFTRFFRAPNILHKDTDGTGLGLYIIKQVLDYVGGRISFTSHEGKGTKFTVLLPVEGMKKRIPSGSGVRQGGVLTVAEGPADV